MEAVGSEVNCSKRFFTRVCHSTEQVKRKQMSKQKLIIMRHAKSDWASGASTDFDRPLASRGNRDAPRMGGWLKENGLIPDVFLSSTALRARQTSSMVAEIIGFPERDIICCGDIYAASLAALLGVIDRYSASNADMLLVGHNPGLDSLLEYLCLDPLTYTDSGKLMTTAAIAVLNFTGDRISTGQGQGQLADLLRPKDIKHK